MTLDEFKDSVLTNEKPDVNPLLSALWYDAAGQWDSAHRIVQEISSREGSLVHAYLHRKEGDRFNAGYWYNRAGREMPAVSIEEEWEALVREFL